MTGRSATVQGGKRALPWYYMGFHTLAEFYTYVTFVLLGMSIMMVTSAVTSAPEFVTKYFIYATGDPDAVAETPLFWDHANTFYNAGTYAMQVITEIASLTPFMRSIPLGVRLFLGLGIPFVELVMIIVVPAATIPTQNGAIAVIMMVALMGGLSKALCDSCTNALVGPFPTKFMNGEQWGLTVVALLMSIIQIILQLSMGSTYQDVLTISRIYFGIGIAIQVMAIMALFLLRYNPFAQQYIAEFRAAALSRCGNADLEESQDSREPATGDVAVAPKAGDKEVTLDEIEEADEVRAVPSETFVIKSGAVLQATGDADRMVDLDQTKNITSTEQMLRASVWSVFKRIYPMLLCAFMIFFTTLLIFPGVFFLVPARSGFYMTIIVTLFNAGDFVARILLMVRVLRPSPKFVIVGTVARLAIIPLVVLCVRGLIPGVAMPYILIFLFGLTNGYFGTMSCIHCPRTPTLHYAGERSVAAMLAGIFLMFGLCFGSNMSLAITLTY
ncbi:nucleoside transporter 1, putative [Leishmania tarentolae]|uniref:Nucleoside transporter 1, putative n=1 Tax=Leishmania tarentolae TaxID=5689 RepID=A0A640KW87_LEITA|nr:nucleoside transporter 1, putative [Leishmania tarentolae]